MPFGMAIATGRINTGNVRTNYDPITPAQTAAGTGVVPGYVYENLACPFGTTFLDVGGQADSVSGTTSQLPAGSQALYKYVLYKSATNPALIARPAIVYYVDETQTTVSGTLADGFTATSADVAGIMMLNTTDNANVTATLLNNGGYGSGIWICIGGLVKGVNAPASTAVGDFLIGASGNFTLARIAAHSGTYTPDVLVAVAMSAVASNASDMLVKLVPIA